MLRASVAHIMCRAGCHLKICNRPRLHAQCIGAGTWKVEKKQNLIRIRYRQKHEIQLKSCDVTTKMFHQSNFIDNCWVFIIISPPAGKQADEMQ